MVDQRRTKLLGIIPISKNSLLRKKVGQFRKIEKKSKKFFEGEFGREEIKNKSASPKGMRFVKLFEDILVQDVILGVHRRVVHHHFKMQMRPGRTAGLADLANGIPTIHALAFADRDIG